MDGRKTRVVVKREPWGHLCQFLLGIEGPDGNVRSVARSLVMEEHKQGGSVYPFMELSDEDVQGFMDELWRVGFRPSEGTGSAGSLAATEKHLRDMRLIVFNRLSIPMENK